MTQYDELLRKALISIESTFQRRAVNTLLSGRDGMLPTASETPATQTDDFDLVTWLVILAP